ncbi:MAG: A/G-specific adenine glycosylase [Bacteroidales bacterium]
MTDLIIDWYLANKRDLPWRNTTNPYFIWLSEVILQQTRVSQGMDYYLRFIESYPTIVDLANAEEDEVLRLWQGLGYYSRARNIHATAKLVRDQYNGVFPDTYKEVLALKGIGPYTAAAICSFAYRLPYAAVDGNVYRVLSRLFALTEPIDSNTGKKLFSAYADELLDRDRPDLFNQAMMEFGAMQCVPQNPDCLNCPLRAKCLAFAKDLVKVLPVKAAKTKVRPRYLHFFDFGSSDFIYLEKRGVTDIWRGLYQLPLIESDTDEFPIAGFNNRYLINNEIVSVRVIATFKHILSHQTLYCTFYKVEHVENMVLSDYVKVSVNNLEAYPIPRVIDKYFEKIYR